MGPRRMILLSGIVIRYDAAEDEILLAAAEKMKRAGIDPRRLHFRLYKKSFDARRRGDIRCVCSVVAEGEASGQISPEKLAAAGGVYHEEASLEQSRGSVRMSGRPVIVGTGPAGMFCGLLLAREGYAPILLERGRDVAGRVKAVEDFYAGRGLDPETNIQFGAGGAGTFSDGKLTTRISDPRCSFVLEALRDFGAPEEILSRARPHVGTDILRGVVNNILNEIAALGGELRYSCRLEEVVEDGSAREVRLATSGGEMSCGALVLAIGHSARDTHAMLMRRGFAISPKSFSVGVRIEHLQRDIDVALYGDYAGDPVLGPAEYALSDTSGRGVYTFCMCPGGEVVGAASEPGGVVVNGMSYHARTGKNANSAIAVSVGPGDYEGGAAGALEFQRGLERAAFASGGGDYSAPAQTVGDFLAGRSGGRPGRILPSYMGGRVSMCDMERILPAFVVSALRRGIVSFGRKIAGFDSPDALLTGVETRTSSPVRILRGEDMTALGRPLIYPCGEGAGYAGGIMSAAVDGIRAAQAIMARYAPAQA